MKSNLIKFGLVCALSAFVFTACVKKEEAAQNQDEQQEQTIENTQQDTTQTVEVEAPEAVVLTEEVVNIEPSDEQDSTASYSNPAPAPQREYREQTAVVSEPTVEKPTQAAAPAVAPRSTSSNEAASIDDAVAEAMRAAQPALEQ